MRKKIALFVALGIVSILVHFTWTHQSLAQQTEFPYLTGCIPTPPEISSRYSKVTLPHALPGPFPTQVDHSADLPPVGRQMSNDCTYWAVIYYYKTFQERKERDWDVTILEHQFSPSFAYNLQKGGICGFAGSLGVPFEVLEVNGCATLDKFPYSYTDCATWPTKEVFADAIQYRIDSALWFFLHNNNLDGTRKVPLTDGDIYLMKNHLASGDVFVIAIPVYNSFAGLTPTNDLYTGPSPGEENEGGHAITIVGYDDAKGGVGHPRRG